MKQKDNHGTPTHGVLLLEIFKLSSGLKGPLLSKKRAGQVGRPDGELAKGFQYSGSYCGALAR